MDAKGSIATFENEADAKAAGYDKPLTKQQKMKLMPMQRAERLATYDKLYAKDKPNNRARAKAARKARRQNRR